MYESRQDQGNQDGVRHQHTGSWLSQRQAQAVISRGQCAITKSSIPDSSTEPSANVTVTNTLVPTGSGLGMVIAARQWLAAKTVIVAAVAVVRSAPTVAVKVAPAGRSGAEISTLASCPAVIAVSDVTVMVEPGSARLPKVTAGGVGVTLPSLALSLLPPPHAVREMTRAATR